jgi:hypothetical protein
MPFQLRSKDRRIQGDGGPGSPGSYVAYNANDIFDPARGTYLLSHYYQARYGADGSWRTGPQAALLMTEMDLLKAEGLLRVNRPLEAIQLINKTRIARGKLPAVSIEGPPNEPGCVPRKMDGRCGSLWDALRHEKKLEGIGVDGVVAFFDARGWQALPQDTPLELPVPGRDLLSLRRPMYTTGGEARSRAPRPYPESCPLKLPRC